MIDSRSLDHLHPVVKKLCDKFMWRMSILHGLGVVKQVFITCTYRDKEKQAELWSLGRDSMGNIIDKSKIVTWARPGQSFHNHEINGVPASLAFDIAFRPWFNNKGATWDGNWWLVGKVAKQCGLEWGGYWPPPKTDKPHLQHTPTVEETILAFEVT